MFSPDGALFAYEEKQDSRFTVIHAKTGELLWKEDEKYLSKHGAHIGFLQNDGTLIDSLGCVWSDGHEKGVLRNINDRLHAIRESPSKRHFAVTSKEGNLYLYEKINNADLKPSVLSGLPDLRTPRVITNVAPRYDSFGFFGDEKIWYTARKERGYCLQTCDLQTLEKKNVLEFASLRFLCCSESFCAALEPWTMTFERGVYDERLELSVFGLSTKELVLTKTYRAVICTEGDSRQTKFHGIFQDRYLAISSIGLDIYDLRGRSAQVYRGLANFLAVSPDLTCASLYGTSRHLVPLVDYSFLLALFLAFRLPPYVLLLIYDWYHCLNVSYCIEASEQWHHKEKIEFLIGLQQRTLCLQPP